MAIGSKVQGWLDSVLDVASPKREKAAELLGGTSEFYFDNNKVSAAERAELTEKLLPLASDPSAEFRTCAAQLVGLMACRCSASIALLSTSLRDDAETVTTAALWACGRLKNYSQPLMPAMLAHANSAHESIRWRLAWAVGESGIRAADVVAGLRRLLADQSYLVRMHAVQAIAGCSTFECGWVVGAVGGTLSDPDPSVRGAACDAISKTPADWSAYRQTLRDLLSDPAPGVQAAAAHAMLKFAPEANEPRLRAWLEANAGYWWAEEALANLK